MWKRWNWLGHVLWREVVSDCFRALGWKPKGQVQRGRPKSTWTRSVEREREKRQGGGAGVWPRRKHVMGEGWDGQFDAFMLIITMTSLRCFAELRYLSHFRFLTYSKCFTSVASLRCFKYLKDLTWGAVLTECALLSWDPSPSWAALVTWDASITRGT